MFNTQKISASDVIEVEAGLRAILRSEYPEVSAERGSALNDLVITSLSYLAAAIRTDARAISEKLYLADLQASDSTDSFNLLQDLASNFLVSTVDTPPKRGRVTFRFTSNITRVIPADITLSRVDNSTNVKLFSTSQDITITPEQYLAVTVDGATMYEYTVLMESVRVADDISILPGEFRSSDSLVDLDSIFNKSPFVGQNNTDYARKSLVERMKHSLQSFTFSSQRGIQATLLNEGIPNLNRVLGVGAGDNEMARDVIPASLSSSKFHSLGMINVVLASTITQETLPLSTGQSLFGGKPILAVLSAKLDSVPVRLVSDFGNVRYTKDYDDITGSSTVGYQLLSGSNDLSPGSVRITVPDSESQLVNGSSSAEKYALYKNNQDLDPTSITVALDNNIPVVQGLIDSEEYNSLGSSIIAMGCCLVQVLVPSMRITMARNVSADSVSLSRIRATVVDYIEAWQQDYPISIGDLQIRLGLVYSGVVTSFSFPQGITYIAYLPDGRFIPFSTMAELGIEDDSMQLYPNSTSYATTLSPLQLSNRVLNYMAVPEDISIEVADV